MNDSRFPFPNRDLAYKELSYDPCYAKIPEADRPMIVEKAWQKGCAAAHMVFQEESGSADFWSIARRRGLQLTEKNTDYVVGGQRYFSDYISGQNCIYLYTQSIRLWAEQNGLTNEQAVNLILSHEYFHFLEVNKLGLTSRDYLVPMLRIGPMKIGKTGIRALSEIGAHAFARTYHDLYLGKEKGNEEYAAL